MRASATRLWNLTASPHYPWLVMGLAFISHGGFSLSGLGLTPLYPFIQDEFTLTRAQVGLITSAAFGASTATGYFFGWACDRYGVRWTTGPLMMLSGLVVASIALAPAYGIILAIAVVVGSMQSLGHPAGAKAIMDWLRPGLRGVGISFKQAGNPAAGAIAALLLPGVAVALGWRNAVLVLGGIIFIAGATLFTLYRDRPRAASRQEAPAAANIWSNLRDVVTDRNLALTLAFGVPLVGAQLSSVTYFMLYANEELNVPVVNAGLMLGAMHISAMFSRVGWGALSDTLGRGRRVPLLVIAALCSAGVLLGLALLRPGTPPWAIFLMGVALGATVQGWLGVHTTLIAELAGPGRVGAAVGYVSTAQRLSIVIVPPLFGLLADTTGTYQWSWLALVGAAMLASVIVLPIKERRPAR